MSEIKPTRATRRVLTALLTGASNLGGYTIYRLTGSAGRAYIVLVRLERAGWVTRTVDGGYGGSGRTFYRLTPEGRAKAMALLGLTEGDCGE